MGHWPKQLAKLTLKNVDKIEDVLERQYVSPVRKAERLLDLKEKIKVSYKSLSRKKAFSHFAWGAAVCLVLTGPALIASMPILVAVTMLPIIYLTGEQYELYRRERNQQSGALIDKCNGELAALYKEDPNIIMQTSPMKTAMPSKGDLQQHSI